jgi:hypothetical protein
VTPAPTSLHPLSSLDPYMLTYVLCAFTLSNSLQVCTPLVLEPAPNMYTYAVLHYAVGCFMSLFWCLRPEYSGRVRGGKRRRVPAGSGYKAS